MAHLNADPSPLGRYAEISRGIAMFARRARNRHQTIADQSALQPRVAGGQTRGNRITGDALRQRDKARPRGRTAPCSMRAMRARRVSIVGGVGIDRSICSPG